MMLLMFDFFKEVLLGSATCFIITYAYFWTRRNDICDNDGDKPSRRSIYMIFHETYEGTNVVTLDWARIPIIVDKLTQKYNDPPSIGKWRYRMILEEEEFEAILNNGEHYDIIKDKTD